VLGDQRVLIRTDADILSARQTARGLSSELGLSNIDQTLLATAISEIARNILTYARVGEMRLSITTEGSRRGVLVVARDDGQGTGDIDLAMRDGYSSSGSLGLGLPGANRLMDEFVIRSEMGRGTTITMKKWAR
jgi:serine/threonine-protein kinase RsbT